MTVVKRTGGHSGTLHTSIIAEVRTVTVSVNGKNSHDRTLACACVYPRPLAKARSGTHMTVTFAGAVVRGLSSSHEIYVCSSRYLRKVCTVSRPDFATAQSGSAIGKPAASGHDDGLPPSGAASAAEPQTAVPSRMAVSFLLAGADD